MFSLPLIFLQHRSLKKNWTKWSGKYLDHLQETSRLTSPSVNEHMFLLTLQRDYHTLKVCITWQGEEGEQMASRLTSIVSFTRLKWREEVMQCNAQHTKKVLHPWSRLLSNRTYSSSEFFSSWFLCLYSRLTRSQWHDRHYRSCSAVSRRKRASVRGCCVIQVTFLLGHERDEVHFSREETAMRDHTYKPVKERRLFCNLVSFTCEACSCFTREVPGEEDEAMKVLEQRIKECLSSLKSWLTLLHFYFILLMMSFSVYFVFLCLCLQV